MGLSVEQWEALCAPANGVEIVEAPDYDGEMRWVLNVDGVEVWADGCAEPEDVCLSRDLAAFVHTIRRLAKERDEAVAAATSLGWGGAK